MPVAAVLTGGTSATATTLAASTTTPVVGQSVTLTATVTATPPAAPPSGTVAFTDSASFLTTCGAQTLAPTGKAGQARATCAAAFGAPGTDKVTATYAGNAADTSSSSAPLTVTVAAAATTVKLGSSGNPAKVGKDVTLRSTVVPVAPASGTPAGTVRFTITPSAGATVTCSGGDTVFLRRGRADCKVPAGALTVAGQPYEVTAAYAGTAQYGASSDQIEQQVVPLVTRVKLVSSQNPAEPAATVSYIATVGARPASDPVPHTGTVTFAWTGSGSVVPVCEGGDTVTVVADQAACTVDGLPKAGAPYTVKASYSGDAENLPSASRTLHQRVRP